MFSFLNGRFFIHYVHMLYPIVSEIDSFSMANPFEEKLYNKKNEERPPLDLVFQFDCDIVFIKRTTAFFWAPSASWGSCDDAVSFFFLDMHALFFAPEITHSPLKRHLRNREGQKKERLPPAPPGAPFMR